jgi:hypothetical protein
VDAAGGHVSPAKTCRRRCCARSEETGLEAGIISGRERLPFDLRPGAAALHHPGGEQLGARRPHQHIDLIYFCLSLDGEAVRLPTPDDVLVWVSEADLRRGEGVPLGSCGLDVPVAEDVRLLALEAIRAVRDWLVESLTEEPGTRN